MNEIIDQMKEAVGQFSPSLLGALLILVLGWILALVVAAAVRAALRRTTFDNRVAQWIAGDKSGSAMPVEVWVSKAVFYLIMLFVLIGFFQALKLPILSDNLSQFTERVTGYLPNLLGAIILLVVAWLIASVLKRGVQSGLKAAKFDERIGETAGDSAAAGTSVSGMIAEAVYWLVFAIFLPAILAALQLETVLEPLNELFNKVMGFIPQLIGAAAILLIGWFIARIIQRLSTSLLASTGIDAGAERWGVAKSLGKLKFSGLIGMILFYVILVPVVISALGALELESVTQPASDMLAKVMEALPAIISAGLVLFLSYLVGRLVVGLLTSVLTGVGFNNLPVKLGLAKSAVEGDNSPASLAGKLALAVIMLFASMEAANLLGFTSLSQILRDFVGFGGHVLMGVIIFAFGLLLANFVGGVVRTSGSPNAAFMAVATRVVILLLAGAMALRQMELANDIVNMAFGLIIGAVAVAVALAFGLGGRDSAASLLADWRQKINKPGGDSGS